MDRHDRFEEWLAKTYKTNLTLLVAADGKFSEGAVRGWRRGSSEPGAENLALLYELGLGVQWYLVGEGGMFSDSLKGQAFAKEQGERVSRAKQVDRAPELVAAIEQVLQRFR